MVDPTEKQLDQALEAKLRSSPEFATWFIGKTRFGSEPAQCYWSRSNHPWGSALVEVPGGSAGETKTIKREGETDVLAVFRVGDKEGIALHIENKLGLGKFTRFQPELYAARAAKWVNNPKYGNYQEWETVLVAPREFYDKYPEESRIFGCFISHEEVARHIDAFMTPSIRIRCIEEQFHQVIIARAGALLEQSVVELPDLASLNAESGEKAWFPVPGMYGGFSYWFEGAGSELRLISESWVRIVEGSGQRHEINTAGSRLIEEGFI